jgi:hypothetical protein
MPIDMQTPITLKRRQDWPEQLAREIAGAQALPYQIGQHDCLRFTCRVIEAMCGVDFWPQFGGYTTLREAQDKIASIAPTLQEAVCLVMGQEPLPPMQARRGDVLVYQDAGGQHLGVCAGAFVALLHRHGLVMLPLNAVGMVCAVRVG